MQKSSTTVKTAQKSLFDRCKRGWNWHFTFSEAEAPSGAKVTEVYAVLLYKTGSNVETVVSGYPYGCGGREDTVVDEIRDAFHDLYGCARDEEIEVRKDAGEWFERTVIDAPMRGDVVADFAHALARIRRVIVCK